MTEPKTGMEWQVQNAPPPRNGPSLRIRPDGSMSMLMPGSPGEPPWWAHMDAYGKPTPEPADFDPRTPRPPPRRTPHERGGA